MKLFLALKKVQNQSSSSSHRSIKKLSLLAKYMICLTQQGDTHLPPLSLIWKALIYKVVITDSLIPAMATHMSSAQMHVPQSNFDNKQDGTLNSKK